MKITAWSFICAYCNCDMNINLSHNVLTKSFEGGVQRKGKRGPTYFSLGFLILILAQQGTSGS